MLQYQDRDLTYSLCPFKRLRKATGRHQPPAGLKPHQPLSRRTLVTGAQLLHLVVSSQQLRQLPRRSTAIRRQISLRQATKAVWASSLCMHQQVCLALSCA